VRLTTMLPQEEWLATPPFMNRFAAAVILAGLSLDEFLDMPADPRRSHFRYFVGDQRIVCLICIPHCLFLTDETYRNG
jgi:hypothetical protein